MDNKRFRDIAKPNNVSGAEEAILEFWNRNKTFEKSVSQHEGDPRFVFYEGPPTANGKPGVHHVLARLCKDIICRYKTMTGHQVIRKAGWDTHGLPVEIEVEKQLGFSHKDEIEAYGVANFNAKCRESVFKYEKEWTRFTQRIGYWLDLDNPYVTYTNDYIETVWWILKQFWDKGLLYEGHKIVPFCPRCETSLSSHEVSLGYKDVDDPSVFIKFKKTDSEDRFLVWTTTPWTLTANAALAVGPYFDYVRVAHNDETLILAEALLGVLDGEYEVLEKFKGEELAGTSYEPLFPFFKDAENGFNVLAGDFVSLEDGTGIVHIAPAFGEEDYKLHVNRGVPILQPVTLQGTFTDDVEPWAGQWIKDADPHIIRALKEEGKLYKSGRITHSYPFCWRCSTALVYYARRSWYVKTTAIKDEMIAANKKINWIPKEVGEHRFGNWLENNVDWALSRERYWGTPLPVWVCEQDDEHRLVVGSIEELRKLGDGIPGDDELDLHRPQVDEFILKCPECGGRMRRVKEVIDAWFDSGSMPFAQYHYPFDESKIFDEQYPSDFISEGIDQSRGWFYSMLVISTFLKGESSYKSCAVTEMILDKKGQKMSKTRGNVVEPWDVLGKEGADALRWYLISSSPPYLPTKFNRKTVIEASQKLLGTLRNVYSFFAMYAELDDYRPSDEKGEPNLIDRWILSRYHTTVAEVRKQLEVFDMTRAARALQLFVLDELSNWYVRRSRRRFWKGEMGPDKLAAYNTLNTVLKGTLELLSPFVPFVAEEIAQALDCALTGESEAESIHLQTFPESDPSKVDTELETLMDTALRVCALGRTVRNDVGIKIRQPLGELVIHDNSGRCENLIKNEEIVEIVLDELHVKKITIADELSQYVTLKACPAYPVLGKRFGKRVPEIVKFIEGLQQADLESFLKSGEAVVGSGDEQVKLGREEMSVQAEGVAPYGGRQEHGIMVALNLEIDEPLRLEGHARELVNRLQNLRKNAGFEVGDRIAVRYDGGDVADQVFTVQKEFIKTETLAHSVEKGAAEWKDMVEFDLEGDRISLWIQRESD